MIPTEEVELSIDTHIRGLLERWVRWLSAGETFGGSLVGDYDITSTLQETYRDPVAEFMDSQIAHLPALLKGTIVSIWYLGKSEREISKLHHCKRGRIRAIHANALAWLGGSIHNTIRREVTQDNLERYCREQLHCQPLGGIKG